MLFLFEKSRNIYLKIFKKHKKAWNIKREQLLSYPKGTLGNGIGEFLEINDFELIDKVERHDGYHVLLGLSTKMKDEVGLQYLLLGNGKRTKYMFAMVFIGTIIFPEYIRYYISLYKRGRKLKPFHDWDFKPLLVEPISDLKQSIR